MSIFDLMNTIVFTLPIADTPVLLSEIIGFVLGVATVWLVARANIWTYPVGIIQCIFFFALFMHGQLYTDMWLQVFFIVAQVVGWWAWLKAGPQATDEKLIIRRMNKAWWIPIFAGIATFVYFMVPVLRDAHGAYPVPDSTTTGLSVAAQILMSAKVIEQWFLWILADLIYIPLYFAKDFYFTSILYVIFLLICIHGFYHWRNSEGTVDGDDRGEYNPDVWTQDTDGWLIPHESAV